jgi:disulfide bond formation protein DsbB
MAIIVLGLLAAALAKKFPKVTFGLLLLSVAALVYGSYTAAFHFGTEQQWWPLNEGCGGENVVPDPDMPIEELIKYMQDRPIIRCDVPCCIFLGISMTGWNFLYSTGLIVFTLFHSIKGYLDARKNKAQA